MFVCVCVCACMCVCVYIYIYIYIYIYTHTHPWSCVCMRVRVHLPRILCAHVHRSQVYLCVYYVADNKKCIDVYLHMILCACTYSMSFRVCLCVYVCVCLCASPLCHHSMMKCTAILIIIERQFHVFQRFSSSKLVLKTVESCCAVLNLYENCSIILLHYVPFLHRKTHNLLPNSECTQNRQAHTYHASQRSHITHTLLSTSIHRPKYELKSYLGNL